MIWAILGWIVFGLVVGALARFLVPGPDPMGMIGTILLGVAGSLVGGIIYSLFRGTAFDTFDPVSFIPSLITAIVLVLIVRKFRTPTTPVA